MENKQKELNLNELEKVNGGHVLPIKPAEDDDNGNSNGNGGGATGGW